MLKPCLSQRGLNSRVVDHRWMIGSPTIRRQRGLMHKESAYLILPQADWAGILPVSRHPPRTLKNWGFVSNCQIEPLWVAWQFNIILSRLQPVERRALVRRCPLPDTAFHWRTSGALAPPRFNLHRLSDLQFTDLRRW